MIINEDYNIAMDMAAGEARPPHFTDAVKLVESDSDGSTSALSDTTRSNSNYQKTGDFLTLKYTETAQITQPFATQTENINPFDVVKFVGALSLSPSRDEWKETERRPELVINQSGPFDTMTANAKEIEMVVFHSELYGMNGKFLDWCTRAQLRFGVG